jgi:hypothetical protein
MGSNKNKPSLYPIRLFSVGALLFIMPLVSSAKEIRQPEKKKADLSSTVIRRELQERGLDLSLKSGSQSLNDALVQYDFQAGGANLNSNSEEILKAIKELNSNLGKTALLSHVTVQTTRPGARIYYQLIGREDAHAIGQLTNHADDDLPIGLYFIWAERDGSATSSKVIPFRVIKEVEPIDIEEKK